MKTVKELDAGDIIKQRKVVIDMNETSETLFNKLAIVGGELLHEVIDSLENNTIKYVPQNGWDGTYCKMIKKEDGHLSFNKTAFEIDCFVRAMDSWPTAQINIANKKVKIYSISYISPHTNSRIGEIVLADSKKGI